MVEKTPDQEEVEQQIPEATEEKKDEADDAPQ